MPRFDLRVADIYCGAGGLSAGFAKARARWRNNRGEHFEIVYGIDKDQNAVDTFNAYHAQKDGLIRANLAECKPISEVTGKSILAHAGVSKIDVLIGGPSCQGVSAAGLRNPNDKRNEMFRRFVELVKELRPKWFVMENVPGLAHANNRALLSTIMEELSSIPGYRVKADMLLAAHFGAPQFRYRIFFVGNRTGAPIRFPRSKIASVTDFKTVKSAIWDLRNQKLGESDVVYNHESIEIEPENVKRIRAIKPGDDWRDMPIKLLPERFFATRASDQKGTYGRLAWNWPAYTITSSASNVTAGPFTHPKADRPLSVREAARLQSFDDNHVFHGPIDSQYRQVGNAVPPLLAKAVAEAILTCHFQREKAVDWDTTGRITLDLIRKESKGKVAFPTLTPRFPGRTPRWDRRPLATHAKSTDEQTKAVKSKVDWINRPSNPFPADLATLKRLARQPGNYRAAKRAKAILGYFEGKSWQAIVTAANKSKANVDKWVAGFLAAGIDGWRAYHADARRLAPSEAKLANKIKASTAKVRKASSEIRLAENGNKRLHMNDYLLKLVERFGKRSVRELIAMVESKLGRGIGTVYVGDLLAICDVVLPGR